MFFQSRAQSDLTTLLGIVGTLVIIGLLFIYSSSSVYAAQRLGSSHYFLVKQCIGAALGLLALVCARHLSPHFIYALTPLFFFGSLALTLATLIPAFSHHIHGSSRWLAFAGFSFQPSELLKIAYIMYLARFLSHKEHARFSLIGTYLPFGIITGLVCLVLLFQPDFGLSMTLLTTGVSLLFIAGLPWMHLCMAGIGIAGLIVGLILTQPYRLKRILTFLDPWSDPQGAGFQIIQSLIAIGAGSWIGSGISNSKQKFFYLPMQHTDFIFSIIAEETGFLGSCSIIILFLLLAYFGMRIAWQLNSSFARLCTLGFIILTTLQAIINIGVVAGLLPTKGIGLPFVSYGMSSLLSFLSMMGLIASFVDHNS